MYFYKYICHSHLFEFIVCRKLHCFNCIPVFVQSCLVLVDRLALYDCRSHNIHQDVW